MARQNSTIFEFGDFRLDLSEKQLAREGEPVQLTPKSFDLLVVLVENAGHLVEKAELMNRVWPDSFVEEANLSVKISELRRALGETSNSNQYIETVPRRGYRFVAAVSELKDSSRDFEDGGSDGGGTRRSNLRLVLITATSVLVIAAIAFVFNVAGVRDRWTTESPPISISSLAVLPLENRSGDPSQDYFADGITESLITGLGKVSDLRVMSRASVMRYKDTTQVPSDIGRDLNVDGVLTGSVVRSNDRVKITVQLIHAATDRNLWSHTYDRELQDVLALQDEVTRGVVEKIRVGLPSNAISDKATRVNPAAYDNYLKGRFHLHRQNRDDNDAAIGALEEAVAADPDFAAAHAELAQAYVWKLFLFDPKDERRWAEKAYLASEKALALDPNLAVAYLARGRLLWTPANHFPHDKAVQEYQRALDLDPNLDEARNQLALVYYHVGLLDESIRESERAIATNPTNNLAQLRIGQSLNAQGKYSEALNVLTGLPQEVNPALIGHQTAWAMLSLGRIDEASALVEQLLIKFPDDTGGVLTSIEAVLAASKGDQSLADAKIKLSIERGKGFGHFHHTAYHIACAHARLNRPAEAVKWLEAAANDGFPCYPMFGQDSNLDNIRSDPAFADLMTRLKQQWEMRLTLVTKPVTL